MRRRDRTPTDSNRDSSRGRRRPRIIVNLGAVLTAFLVVFPLELPDKSLIASLVLATRFRPLPVWLGVAAAFCVHVVIAVALGGLLTLLPERLVQVVVAIAFAVGSAVVLFGGGETNEDGEQEVADAAIVADRDRPTIQVIASAFALIFVAEWGDMTQIVTANLAAQSRAPASVAVGALLALWTVAAIGITAGRLLLRYVPLTLVRRCSGLILAGLAVWTVYDLVVD